MWLTELGNFAHVSCYDIKNMNLGLWPAMSHFMFTNTFSLIAQVLSLNLIGVRTWQREFITFQGSPRLTLRLPCEIQAQGESGCFHKFFQEIYDCLRLFSFQDGE